MSSGKVLLIDDEPGILKNYKRELRREGYTVDTAESGEKGWEMYQAVFYDVVITDWRMHKMSGLDLLHRIDQKYPFSAKVIMITGVGNEDTMIKAHHYHTFDYFRKPVDMDDLLNSVKTAVQRRDGIIAAIEDWVETHPEEAERRVEATLPETDRWSAKDVLDEIKKNTEKGRQEYRNLVQLTIDLLTRGRIR